MNFYKDMHQEDIIISYVHQLAGMQSQLINKTEAGALQRSTHDQLQADVDRLQHDVHRLQSTKISLSHELAEQKVALTGGVPSPGPGSKH